MKNVFFVLSILMSASSALAFSFEMNFRLVGDENNPIGRIHIYTDANDDLKADLIDWGTPGLTKKGYPTYQLPRGVIAIEYMPKFSPNNSAPMHIYLVPNETAANGALTYNYCFIHVSLGCSTSPYQKVGGKLIGTPRYAVAE